jgi:hypothetical protein
MVLGLVAGLTRRIGMLANRSRRVRVALTAAGLVAVGADAGVAAASRPFTLAANLTTALGLAGIVAAGLVRLSLPREVPAPASLQAPPTDAGALDRSSIVAWIALALAVATFELVNFVSNPRSAHPTLSSLLNAITGHEVLRGLLFVLWLGAGWWIWGRE